MIEWIGATALVVLAVLATGRLAGWALGRANAGRGPARQLHRWRVAPDAQLRVVEVLGQVHVVLERGPSTTLLQQLPADEFGRQLAAHPTAAPAAGRRAK